MHYANCDYNWFGGLESNPYEVTFWQYRVRPTPLAIITDASNLCVSFTFVKSNLTAVENIIPPLASRLVRVLSQSFSHPVRQSLSQSAGFHRRQTRRATHKSVARTWLALLHQGVRVCECVCVRLCVCDAIKMNARLNRVLWWESFSRV